MIKKTSNFRKKTPSLFLAVIILLSAVFSSTDNLMAYDESSGYCFQVAENEEGTEADIKGDSTKIYEGVEIIEILDPDGRAMDLDNISYHVTQNDVYLFQIFFRSPAGEQKENISISVNSLLDSDTKTNKADESSDPETNIDNAGTDADPEANANKTDENSASETKTVGELKAAGKLEQKASTPFLIPMHIEGEDTSQGNYSFSGGDIVNIEEQTFNGLPYKFQQAVILIMEGGDAKTYPINYYDEINGIKYYALSGNDSSPQDFEIAYEVPEGADIFFILL